MTKRHHKTRAFTLIELLVLVTIVGILGLIIASAVNGADARVRQITCEDNLRKIGESFASYSRTHSQVLPTENLKEEEFSNFQFLEKFPKLSKSSFLLCPSDVSRSQNAVSSIHSTQLRQRVSYFFSGGFELKPGAILAGDRNLSIAQAPVSAGVQTLSPMQEVGWSSDLHGDKGNILQVDGSVRTVSDRELRELLQPESGALRVVVP